MPFDPDVEIARLRSVLRGLGWEVIGHTQTQTALTVTVTKPVPQERQPQAT